jgi:Fe-S cluster assembly iron-binding protein IscA
MLTMTDSAVAVIRDLTSQHPSSSSAGLRIAADRKAGRLTFTLAEHPVPGDQVLDDAGVRVFLDEPASLILDRKALDAAIDNQGRVQFGFAEQPGPGPS